MSGSPATGALSDLPLADVLERLAARTPAPGGGAGAAVCGALAAALVQMASGYEGPGAGSTRGERAAELRRELLELVERDLHAFEPVLVALRRPADDAERPSALADALSAASDPPLEMARAAAELAELAVGAADAASRHLLGDCVVATVLASAACRAAAVLVALNLEGAGADTRREEASRLAGEAEAADRNALLKANES